MLRAIVVGAGFSGAVTARLLAEAGYQVELIEQRGTIAGNCYDYVDSNGVIVQAYGAHLFHTDSPAVMALLNRFAGFFPYRHTVLAETEGTLVPVPFNLRALDLLFSPAAAAELRAALLASYPYGARLPLGELRKNGNPSIRRLAGFIQEKLYVPYTEKQWGRPLDQLDESVGARVPVVLSEDGSYFDSRFQCMPQGGFTPLFERMLSHPGIRLTLSCNALERLRPEGEDLLLDGKPTAVPVVWTGRLDALFSYRFGALPYRSLRFGWKRLPDAQCQPVGVINCPKAPGYTRRLEFKHFTGSKNTQGTTVAYEYPRGCGRNDIPFYPVPSKETTELHQKYLAAAGTYKNLYPLGRLAQYRYCNMDEAVEAALDLAARVRRDFEDI